MSSPSAACGAVRLIDACVRWWEWGSCSGRGAYTGPPKSCATGNARWAMRTTSGSQCLPRPSRKAQGASPIAHTLGRLSRRLVPPLVHSIVEREREEDRHGGREGGRQPPELVPLRERQPVGAGEEAVVDVAGDLCSDQHADAVGDEHEESLRLPADRRRRL